MGRHLEWYLQNTWLSPLCWSGLLSRSTETDTVSPCCFSSEIQSRLPSQAAERWTSLFLPVESKRLPELGGNPLPVFWTETLGEVSWTAKWLLQDTIIVCSTFSQKAEEAFLLLLFPCFTLHLLSPCSAVVSCCPDGADTAVYVVQMQSMSLEEGDSLHTKRRAAKLTGKALLK